MTSSDDDEAQTTTEQYYRVARHAVADLLAAQKGLEAATVTEWNEAYGILWPHLSMELQSKLVLR